MQITDIWMSQRKLRRIHQIPAMMELLEEGGCLPRITLSRSEDGSIQVEDGHHRLTAIWLTRRQKLHKQEYLLLEKNQWKPRFGKIINLTHKEK